VILSRAIAFIVLIATLSSCATIFSGYTDEIRVYGSDIPLTFRDKEVDTVIPSRFEITDLGLVHLVELDKRADIYNLEVVHGVSTSTLHLIPSLNYTWLIPNYLNAELGFLIDYHTRAAYRYEDQHLYFERTPGGLRIESPVYDSVIGVIAASLGFAFPMFYPAQGPGSVSASFGVKVWRGLVLGADVGAAGTSDGVDARDVVNMNSSMFGIFASYYPSKGFFVTLQPTFHRISYYQNQLEENDTFLGSRNHVKLAFGAGARTGGFMVDFRVFPSAATEVLTNGRRVHSGLVQVRLGYSGDILLWR